MDKTKCRAKLRQTHENPSQSVAQTHTFTMNDLSPQKVPARARQIIRLWMGENHPRTYDLQTLATELITNAVSHGLGSMPTTRWIRMRLEHEASFIRLTVTDPGHSGTFPQLGHPVNDPGPDDDDTAIETGRGLHIVHSITAGSWGHYYNVQNERVVWALVPSR